MLSACGATEDGNEAKPMFLRFFKFIIPYLISFFEMVAKTLEPI